MDPSHSLRCAPTRRPLKFQAGDHAQHFLLFDPSISKHDRMVLYMELFAYIHYFIDPEVLPHFSPAKYLPEQYVELRVLTDPRHPAYGQIGLFAKRTIPANTVVTPYSGYIEIFSTSCSSRTYTMGFGSLGDDYALDAEFAGNYGRFANDPRGVDGFLANITAESRFTSRGEAYTALVSRRIINKGEEILMSYGKAHSLSASPWVGLKGELLTRHRAGGIVPFPQFSKRRRMDINIHPKEGVSTGTSYLPTVHGSLVECRESTQRNCHGEVSTLNGTLSAVKEDEGEEKQDAAEMILLWECPQCGTWSIGNPTPVNIEHCFLCQTPRLHRSRMVAVCCTSPLSCEDVLTSAMNGVTPVTSSPLQASIEDGNNVSTTQFNTSSSSLSEGNCVKNSHGNGSTGSASVDVTQQTSAVQFDSESVGWPLNVPFLPWQVWDAAIPLASIGKHAKFETHESIFLYAVTTASEDEQRMMGGGVGKPNRDENDTKQYGEEEWKPEKRGRKPRVRRKKEELWQKEEVLPNGVQQQLDTRSAAKSVMIMSSSEAKPSNRSNSAVDYLFYINSSDSYDENASNGGEENTTFIALQSLLRGVIHRLFAGKSYHTGEVVAAVGGMIVPTSNGRQRPDGSVLEIPMKHFLHAKARRELRHMLSCRKEGGSARNEDVDESMAVSDLLRRLEGLSLVVTNELMFCPCLLLRDDENEHDCDDTSDNKKEKEATERAGNCLVRRHPLIEMCNLSFVLTMDALGCPYVAAVAMRDINTFEPFLACIGS